MGERPSREKTGGENTYLGRIGEEKTGGEKKRGEKTGHLQHTMVSSEFPQITLFFRNYMFKFRKLLN